MASIEYNRSYTATITNNTLVQYMPIETVAGAVGDVYVIKSITLTSETDAFGTQAFAYNYTISTSDDVAATNLKLVYSQPNASTPVNSVFTPFAGASFISKQPYLGFRLNLANASVFKVSIVYSKIPTASPLAANFLVASGTSTYNAQSVMLGQQAKTIIIQSNAVTNIDATGLYGFKTFIGSNPLQAANMTGVNLMPAQSVVLTDTVYIPGTSTTGSTNALTTYVTGTVVPGSNPLSYYISYILAGT